MPRCEPACLIAGHATGCRSMRDNSQSSAVLCLWCRPVCILEAATQGNFMFCSRGCAWHASRALLVWRAEFSLGLVKLNSAAAPCTQAIHRVGLGHRRPQRRVRSCGYYVLLHRVCKSGHVSVTRTGKSLE